MFTPSIEKHIFKLHQGHKRETRIINLGYLTIWLFEYVRKLIHMASKKSKKRKTSKKSKTTKKSKIRKTSKTSKTIKTSKTSKTRKTSKVRTQK